MCVTLLRYSCCFWCTQSIFKLTHHDWYIFTYGRCEDVPLWLDLFLDEHLWRLMDFSLPRRCYQTYVRKPIRAYQLLGLHDCPWFHDMPAASYGIQNTKKLGKCTKKEKTWWGSSFFWWVPLHKLYIYIILSKHVFGPDMPQKSRSVLKSTTGAKWHLDYCFCWVVRSIPSGENKKRPNNAPAGYEIAPLLRQNAVPSWSPRDPWRLGGREGGHREAEWYRTVERIILMYAFKIYHIFYTQLYIILMYLRSATYFRIHTGSSECSNMNCLELYDNIMVSLRHIITPFISTSHAVVSKWQRLHHGHPCCAPPW